MIANVEITIDNREPVPGTMTIETLTETVYSDNATRPDPEWRHVDTAGHFHSWSRGDTYPTLERRKRHVDCDGSCGGVCGGEGFDVIDHHCRICGEQVKPGRVPDNGAHVIPTGRSWTVEAQVPAPQGRVVMRPPSRDRVTVRITDREHGVTWFGVAMVGVTQARSSLMAGAVVTTTFHGAGALGEFSVPVPVA